MMPRLVLSLAACLTLISPALSQSPHRGEVTITPYSFVTFDGQSHPAELGHLWVPENRRGKSDRLIQIAFVRLKSSAAQPSAPIVYLAGGPGVPGSGMARVPVYYELFDKLRQVGDVILLDQRGSGMSSPNLSDCPVGGKLPIDALATAQKFRDALAQSAGSCASYWKSKGVDLTGYNTEESADDVDDLRQALGATQISLLGHSYGTELALAVIRRHGKSIHRAVLASVEGPGDHDTESSVLDLQLKKIAYLVAKDPNIGKDIPDMAALFQNDAERLDNQPAELTITRQATRQTITLRVGGSALRFITERMLANGRAVTSLPALLQSINAGDYSLLQQQAANMFNDFDSGITLMGLTMDCSALTPSDRLVQAEAEARISLFGDVSRIDMQPEVCSEALGKFSLGPDYFAPLFSTVPTLFLSGTLDANTPAMKAERMRWGFPDSTLIVVENGFHETLPADAVQDIVVDFFKGEKVSARHVEFPVPHFLTIDEAKRPQGPPR